jgi:hypothetical protein
MEGSKACRLDLKCRSLWHCRRESEQSGWELRRGKEMEEEVQGRGGGDSLPLGPSIEW